MARFLILEKYKVVLVDQRGIVAKAPPLQIWRTIPLGIVLQTLKRFVNSCKLKSGKCSADLGAAHAQSRTPRPIPRE